MLKNTAYRLKNKMPLTIGYLGGSITEGAGVEDERDCWRCRVTKWFCDNYPDSEIIEAAAGIGGTGSDLGMFRCDIQIITKKPDLVFIEFAVNDGQRENSLECMETIVRKILNYNPITDIVFVITASKSIHECIMNGGYVRSYDTHKIIAERYGIDIVNVGEEIISRVDSGESTWETYTIDTVHPNVLGYTLYTNTVIKYLKQNLSLPYPISADKYEDARMIDVCCYTNTSFINVDGDFCSRADHYMEASDRGQFIEFKFTGRCVGINMMIASDSGDFTWSIDGSEPVRCSSWDKYALKFERANYTVFSYNLEYGEHILRLEALGEHDVQSKGSYIRIASFLIA